MLLMKKGDLESALKNDNLVGMLAPSFVVDFSYPCIIGRLKKLGFDKVVELTFGAKMINRDYHKELKNSKGLKISSVCPGIVEVIKNKFPEHKDKLISVDSPMVAMAKIVKKTYPAHKIVFISPCDYKKIEAEKCNEIDYVINYNELRELFNKNKIGKVKCSEQFDKFYNDYTKIYPVSGGLYKTAHLKNIISEDEVVIIDGIKKVVKFLENPNEKIKFMDVTFCEGGCIGGPCVKSKFPIFFKKRKVLNYLKKAKREDIPEIKKGLIDKAKGISFKKKY